MSQAFCMQALCAITPRPPSAPTPIPHHHPTYPQAHLTLWFLPDLTIYSCFPDTMAVPLLHFWNHPSVAPFKTCMLLAVHFWRWDYSGMCLLVLYAFGILPFPQAGRLPPSCICDRTDGKRRWAGRQTWFFFPAIYIYFAAATCCI